MHKKISVAVISGYVGKSPEEVAYSFVFDEVYRLARKGVNIHVIRGKIEKDSTSYGIHFHGIEKMVDPRAFNTLMKNIRFYPPISLLRNPIYLYYENLYSSNVSKVIKKYDIDLIHAHFAYREGLVGLLAKTRTKKPLIVTCHGYDINTVPEVGYGIRLRKRYDGLVRLVLKNADAIICVSNDMKNKVLRLGINKEKVFVVFNGVDINLFRPTPKKESDRLNEVRSRFGINEDDFVILNARHLRPIYGIECIIYAAKMVTEQVKKAKFIIAGEGKLKQKLATMIHSMNLEKNVKLIGSVQRSLMPRLMQASSLYINTSLADGMSPSMLEACASGLPIVSFDVGGAGDIVDDGVNGFLVPVKDWKMLAARIVFLIQNADILRNMSRIARKKAQEKFDINKRIDIIMSIYKHLSKIL